MTTTPLPANSLPPPAPRPRVVKRIRRAGTRRLVKTFGGPARARVVVVLGAVLALSSADTATVGASATPLRHALHISNADLGLLVGVNCVVAAIASIPFGVLADRFSRTKVLGWSIVLWGACMVWSATVGSFGHLILSRLALGVATASSGPAIASMLGDWIPSAERGRVYSYILTGELLGGGVGFAVTGDVSALSWRASFLLLAIPAFVLARQVLRLPEPVRGGRGPIPVGALTIPRQATITDEEAAAEGENGEPENIAHQISQSKGLRPNTGAILIDDPQQMGLIRATRYIMSIRTNVLMIVASACCYFYLTGVQTFGSELVHNQYNVNQALANLLILVLGVGAVIGVLVGGRLGDGMLKRRFLNSRVFVAAVSCAIATAAFIPALTTHHSTAALPYLVVAAFGLSAQNPPLNAARLDIMPSALWGRAEGIRTFLRTAAQALAPVIFGATSDTVFGNHHNSLQLTFLVMLVPLAVSSLLLFRAMGSYPRDVATAAAAQ